MSAIQALSKDYINVDGLLGGSPIAGTVFEVNPNRKQKNTEPTQDISEVALIDAINATKGADRASWTFSTSMACMIIDAISRCMARGEPVDVNRISKDVFSAFRVRCAYSGVTVFIGTDSHCEEIALLPKGTITTSTSDGVIKKHFDEAATKKAESARKYAYGKFINNGRVIFDDVTNLTVLKKYPDSKRAVIVSSLATAYRLGRFIAKWCYTHMKNYISKIGGQRLTIVHMNKIREMVGDNLGDTYSKLDFSSRAASTVRRHEPDFHKRIVNMKGLSDAPLAQINKLVEHFNTLYMKKAHGAVRLAR